MIPSSVVFLITLLLIMVGTTLIGLFVGLWLAIVDWGGSGCCKIACGAVGGLAGGFIGMVLTSGISQLLFYLAGDMRGEWHDVYSLGAIAFIAISPVVGAFVAVRVLCPKRSTRARSFTSPWDDEEFRLVFENTMEQGNTPSQGAEPREA